MEILERSWDSEFFGFPVAAFEYQPDQRFELDSQYRLIYGFGPADEAWRKQAEAHGGVLIDQAVDYEIDLQQLSHMDHAVNHFVESHFGQPDEALYDLALIAGHDSRFRRDPRFPEGSFERMYRIWIERSAKRELAEEVLFIEDFARKVAMLTIELKDDIPRIGLVSTAEDYQSRGLASDLVKAAWVWAINRNYDRMRVRTQVSNAGACRFYEKLGFQKREEEWIFHFWRES